jgi:phosphatidylserine/phosphatidylglycerophosphate/cardiolipin synthase-like enzyme
MEAIFWLSGIALSIVISVYVGKFLGKHFPVARFAGLTVAAFWLIWTFGFSSLIVGYALTGPLAIFQTIIIVVTFWLSYRRLKEKQEADTTIQSLKTELLKLDNKRLKAVAEKVLASKYEIITTPEEHRAFFLRTMKEASDSVIILSGWATDYAVNDEFKSLLKSALARGVNVFIGYGYQRKGDKPPPNYHKQASRDLSEIAGWCAKTNTKGHLKIRKFPNHAKMLIKDDEFAVNGGFNWLSNVGRSHNQERSWVIYNRDFVTAERDQIIEEMDSMKEPTRRSLIRRIFPFSDRD